MLKMVLHPRTQLVSLHFLSAIEGLEPITFGFDTKGLDCRATNNKTTFGDIRQRQKNILSPLKKIGHEVFLFSLKKSGKILFPHNFILI